MFWHRARDCSIHLVASTRPSTKIQLTCKRPTSTTSRSSAAGRPEAPRRRCWRKPDGGSSSSSGKSFRDFTSANRFCRSASKRSIVWASAKSSIAHFFQNSACRGFSRYRRGSHWCRDRIGCQRRIKSLALRLDVRGKSDPDWQGQSPAGGSGEPPLPSRVPRSSNQLRNNFNASIRRTIAGLADTHWTTSLSQSQNDGHRRRVRAFLSNG